MMDKNTCLIPTFGELTPQQIMLVNDNSHVVTLDRNEPIFKQGKPTSYAMFIRSGLVKIFSEFESKKYLILKITGPGKYIGLISVFCDRLYQYSATALEKSEIVYLSLPTLHEIISQNGKFSMHMINLISNEGLYLINRIHGFSQKQVPGRIAEVLLFFSREVYKKDNFTLPISRTELAEIVSSTKESVSRALTEFKNDRMIEIVDKSVKLKSIELLEILCKMR